MPLLVEMVKDLTVITDKFLKCRIHLIQLPPYSPHLNPIERLWVVMHQHVLDPNQGSGGGNHSFKVAEKL